MRKWEDLNSNLNHEQILRLMKKYLKETEAFEYSRLLTEYGTVETLLNCPENGYVTHCSPNWRTAKVEYIVTF